MKTFFKTFPLCLLFVATFITSSAFAQNQVRITLHQPPPNQLSAKDLWKMTLENTTGSPLEIYLEGYGDEQKAGRIVDGRSLVFTLPPGRSNYNYENFKSGNVSWKNWDYEEFIVRTGTVPAGTYTTCVTAYSSDGDIVGMEKCMTQVISRGAEGEITLVSPSDGEEIDPSTPVTFVWVPFTSDPKVGYSLKIAEVKKGQSPEEALRIWPLYDKQCPPNCIYETKFVYPSNEKKFEEGKIYAWQVSSGSISSNVSMFSLRSNNAFELIVDSVKCTGVMGEYEFWTRVCVRHDNTVFQMADIQPFGFTNNNIPSGVTYTITSTNPTLPVQISTPSTGELCISISGTFTTNPASVVTAVEFLSSLDYGTNPWEKLPIVADGEPMNNCCVDPPSGMVCWWDFDETTGTIARDRAGFNNEGTYVNSPQVISNERVGNSLRFSGNNYVEVDGSHSEVNFGACQSFTIDAWIRPDNSQIHVRTILDKREATCGASTGYALYLYNGRIGIQLGNGTNFQNISCPTSVPPVTLGEWSFVAVTYDASSQLLTFYQRSINVPGNITGLSHPQNIVMPNLNNFASLVIGSRHPNFGLYSFSGDIDEVEFFKRALTLQEIQSIYNAGSAGKCKGTPWEDLFQLGVLRGEDDRINQELNIGRASITSTEFGEKVEIWYSEFKKKDGIKIIIEKHPSELNNLVRIGRKLMEDGGTLDNSDLDLIGKSLRLMNDIAPAPKGLIEDTLNRLKETLGKNWKEIMEELSRKRGVDSLGD